MQLFNKCSCSLVIRLRFVFYCRILVCINCKCNTFNCLSLSYSAHRSKPANTVESNDAYKRATIALAVTAGIAIVIIALLVLYIVSKVIPKHGLYIALTDIEIFAVMFVNYRA